MMIAFIRFFIALLALIGVCVYSVTMLSGEARQMGLWVALLVAVPAVSFSWSAFARKCYSEEVRKSSPMLYAVGMLFGVPQKVFGLVCFLVGLVWIYSYLSGSVRLSIITIVFSFGLLILGLSWLINCGLAALQKRK
ncbi:MAG: hypothetical protein ACRCWR_13495 [Saezia sp.]